jgi:predicted transcriptional regulator
MGMQLQFNNPELQAKLEQWVADTGRSAEELVEDAMADYFDQMTRMRENLDSRYDDIESGRVKLIPGEEVEAYFRNKSANRSSHNS